MPGKRGRRLGGGGEKYRAKAGGKERRKNNEDVYACASGRGRGEARELRVRPPVSRGLAVGSGDALRFFGLFDDNILFVYWRDLFFLYASSISVNLKPYETFENHTLRPVLLAR